MVRLFFILSHLWAFLICFIGHDFVIKNNKKSHETSKKAHEKAHEIWLNNLNFCLAKINLGIIVPTIIFQIILK